MTLSKRQLKINKQLRESLTYKLNKELKDFKNLYFKSYVEFFRNKIVAQANKFSNCETQGDIENLYLGKTHKETGVLNTTYSYKRNSQRYLNSEEVTYVSKNDCYNAWKSKSNAQLKLDRNELLVFGFMNEANDSYEKKFERLINRCMESKLVNNLKVERIGSGLNEFEILIKDIKGNVLHSRFIFANGLIKAPHYRFIITERFEEI